jgi:predicted site-specific integrase-resolvase
VVKTNEFGMRWTLDIGNTHWVTQRVAAGLLGVSVMTVNKWVRERKLGKTMLRNGVSVISMRVLERIAESRGVFLRT